jgi:hypothetical protein
LVLAGGASFGLSLAFPFVFSVMVPAMGFYWMFLLSFWYQSCYAGSYKSTRKAQNRNFLQYL